MAAPNVETREIDLSTRVPSFPGVFGGLVIPALKGPLDEPFLVTSETEFLRVFTPDSKIPVGADLSHFSATAFLQQSNRLWIQRVANGALFGGATFVQREGTDVISANAGPYTFNAGEVTSTIAGSYVFAGGGDDLLDIKVNGGSTVNVVFGAGTFTAAQIATAINALTTPDVVAFDVGGFVKLQAPANPTPISIEVVTGNAILGFTPVLVTADDRLDVSVDGGGLVSISFGTGVVTTTQVVSDINLAVLQTPPFAVENVTPQTFTLHAAVSIEIFASSTALTILGLTPGLTVSAMSASLTAGLVDPDSFVFTGTEPNAQLFLLYGKNEGAWNNNISVKIFNSVDSPTLVAEPDAFIIEVWNKIDGVNTLVESFEVSRVVGQKDGFGRNMFIEDRLVTSEFIDAVNNIAIADTILPKEVTVLLPFAGGSDGAAVTDATMILGLEPFKNQEDKPVTVFMDGGWATPAFGNELILLAQGRTDVLSILSVPFLAEASSNFLNDIVDYRRTTLNANTSFAALYSPHPKIFDKFNNRSIFVAPDGFVGAVISFTAANFELWFPPAGFRRGIIQVLDLRRRFSKGQMDFLYDNQVNPLRFAPGRGILVWGQKTLLSRPSRLDRVNVRLLLIVLEPAIAFALEDFIFELNDAPTRNSVKSIIDSFMDGIQARRGVTDFETVVDETNNLPINIDNNELIVWLFVKPTVSVEFIKFNVIITREGLSFALAAESL